MITGEELSEERELVGENWAIIGRVVVIVVVVVAVVVVIVVVVVLLLLLLPQFLSNSRPDST